MTTMAVVRNTVGMTLARTSVTVLMGIIWIQMDYRVSVSCCVFTVVYCLHIYINCLLFGLS